MKIWVKRGHQGVTYHFWEFWDPLHVSATVEARNMKFGTQIDREVPYRKKSKFGSKGAARGSRDHFREFWDPLHISATVEARGHAE